MTDYLVEIRAELKRLHADFTFVGDSLAVCVRYVRSPWNETFYESCDQVEVWNTSNSYVDRPESVLELLKSLPDGCGPWEIFERLVA